MPPQRFGQALLSKFFSRRVEGFRDAVRVQSDGVSWEEVTFPDRSFPFLEEAQNRARGVQPVQSVIAAEQKSWEMSTVGIAQALRAIVVFGEEKRGIGVVGPVLS